MNFHGIERKCLTSPLVPWIICSIAVIAACFVLCAMLVLLFVHNV